MEFLIATNNRHKVIEIKRILESLGHTGISLEEAGVRILVEETGRTYGDNAMLKAAAACEASGRIAIGDDSGLEVDALSGAPGIKSARFAGEHATDQQNNKQLLFLLERTPYVGRTAHFVCAIALASPDGKSLIAEGICDGMIGFAAEGSDGFGYDPLFFYNGHSFASMTDEEKDAVSHRGNALRNLDEMLSQLEEEETLY